MNTMHLDPAEIPGSTPESTSGHGDIEVIRTILSGGIKPEHHRLFLEWLSAADFEKPLDRHSIALHRSTYDRLVKLAARLPAGAGDLSDPSLLSALAEWTAVSDPSLCIAALIHYGLCIGSLVELGQGNPHARQLAHDLAAGNKVGAFMITEIGNGNSQLAARTEARFDPARREFILHTPDDGALKFSNVGVHDLDKIGVVCARLVVADQDCGVFAFAFDLSTRHGPLPGVRLSTPAEIPLVPFDYGLAGFDHLRIPFDAWLSDGASIDAAGRFHDPLDPPGARLVRTLSAPKNVWALGALALAAVTRTSAAQALRYSARRTSMARVAPETSLLRYGTQRRGLFRALATAYVMTCLANDAARHWRAGLTHRAQPERADEAAMVWAPWSSTSRELSLVKALTAWATEEVAAECRLRSGVAGDLLVNRFLDYQGLGHVFNDAGGNNFLILLDTAHALAAAPPAERPPRTLGAHWPDLARSACDALGGREHRLCAELAARIGGRDTAPLEVWNPLLPVARDAADMHGLNLALDAAIACTDSLAAGSARTRLVDLTTLFAIDRMQRHAGGLISDGWLDPALYRSLDAATDALCERLLPHVDTLVDAFGHPHAVTRAPLADPSCDYATALARALHVPPAA
jgi:acyl-CoA oxidase